MDVAVQRLCVIDCDSDGNVCFYPLRQTEDISGDLYEYLDNMTRGKQIVENLDKGEYEMLLMIKMTMLS